MIAGTASMGFRSEEITRDRERREEKASEKAPAPAPNTPAGGDGSGTPVADGVPLEAQDSDGRTPLHLACLMAGREGARGSEHAQVVAFLQEQGAATGTQDVYGHTPLSYLPPALKSIGRKTSFVDGREPSWVVSVVDEKSAVRQGAVAQVVATMTR